MHKKFRTVSKSRSHGIIDQKAEKKIVANDENIPEFV